MYSVPPPFGFPAYKQAEPDRDFVTRVSFITMADGATSASVVITVTPVSSTKYKSEKESIKSYLKGNSTLLFWFVLFFPAGLLVKLFSFF